MKAAFFKVATDLLVIIIFSAGVFSAGFYLGEQSGINKALVFTENVSYVEEAFINATR